MTRRQHRWWRGPGAVAAGLLVGAALGAGPARAATFRIAVGIDPDTMDPVQTTTTTVGNLVDYTVETLTTIDEAGRILPLLAEGWTVSADGRQYTFKLHPGVRFHDGSPFDAKAVKWNFDRLIDPAVRVPIRAAYPIEKTLEIMDGMAGQHLDPRVMEAVHRALPNLQRMLEEMKPTWPKPGEHGGGTLAEAAELSERDRIASEAKP